MMNLPTDFWDWVSAHAADDPARLRLKYGRDRALEILQIEARRKYAAKFGDLFERLPQFVVPNGLSPEQSTSMALARFHASLVPQGATAVDLTAGMGIDVLALADRCASVTAVEIDPDIADALRHNFAPAANVQVVCGDCRDFISRCLAENRHFDVAFIDPARRGDAGQRLYALDHCQPDVVALMPQLLNLAPTVIVKASPMLDITHTLRVLPQARHLYTVGTATECKELLIVCAAAAAAGPVQITAATVAGGGVGEVSFTREEEAEAEAVYAAPQVGWWVYDPYPAVMKAAAWKLLCRRYGVAQTGPNTRLWTSPEKVAGFPGHAFQVAEVLPYASKHIKRYAAAHPRVSVSARNFDIDSATLRRKLGVADGGPERLFALRGPQGEKLLVTTRV